MRDLDNRNRSETIPSLLTEICGIEVEEQLPLKFQDKIHFRSSKGGSTYHGSYWFDLLSLHGATSIANYEDRWFSGSPAITRNEHGTGRVYYVGTVPEVGFLRSLLSDLCTEVGILPNVTKPSTPLMESLKVFRFSTDSEKEEEYLHLINFTAEHQDVTLPAPHKILPSGFEVSGLFTLSPFASYLLRKA
jgi:beta-galactosidase